METIDRVTDMGIDPCHARFLLSAAGNGVCFRRTATLGRQTMLIEAHKLKNLISEFGFSPRPDMLGAAGASCSEGGAEAFMRLLGAEEIVSIDASAYESCSFVHDLNRPVPSDLRSRFDTVIDGGTLEHIFNFPVAIKNCMDMLAVGGCFLSATAANNFAGHGFYQFSPELFYRVFSPENGFVIERAFVSEAYVDKEWYWVPDPAQVRSRVEFISARPTYLLIQARKIRQIDSFCYPQQSDYAALWRGQPDLESNRNSCRTPKARPKAEFLRLAVRVVPGAKRLAAALRRYSAQRLFISRLLRGPWGDFLQESSWDHAPQNDGAASQSAHPHSSDYSK